MFSIDGNLAEVLIALIAAIGSYFGGYRYGRKRHRRSDVKRVVRDGEFYSCSGCEFCTAKEADVQVGRPDAPSRRD